MVTCLTPPVHIEINTHVQGGPQKSKPLANDQKIVLKSVSDIGFIRQIKV